MVSVWKFSTNGSIRIIICSKISYWVGFVLFSIALRGQEILPKSKWNCREELYLLWIAEASAVMKAKWCGSLLGNCSASTRGSIYYQLKRLSERGYSLVSALKVCINFPCSRYQQIVTYLVDSGVNNRLLKVLKFKYGGHWNTHVLLSLPPHL